MKYDRCANALDCFMKLKRDLSKNGDELKMKKLREYEMNGDQRVVESTIYTTTKTHIGFGTESKQQYEKLRQDNQLDHIIFTDRENIPDMKALANTLKLSQVQGYTHQSNNSKWRITSANLPCACEPCLENSAITDACLYKDERNIVHQYAENKTRLGHDDDLTGISSMDVSALKDELRARGLSLGGRKMDLVERLKAAVQMEFSEDDDNGSDKEAEIQNSADADDEHAINLHNN